MPQTQKYRVDTDKGSFEVEVETPEAPFAGSYGLMADAAANQDTASPAKEPDTYAGGFLKSIKDQVAPPLSGRNPLIAGAAQPKNIGDFLSLLIPSGVTEAYGAGKRVLSAGLEGAKEGSGIKGTLTGFTRGMSKAAADVNVRDVATQNFNKLPLTKQMEDLPTRVAPDRGRSIPPPRPNLGRETVASGVSPRLVKGTPASTLEEELLKSLSDSAPAAAETKMSMLPPEQTITPGGPTRQSGKFGKSGSLGQAGGYTSGRPATTAAGWEAEASNVARNAPYGEGSIIPSTVKPTELSEVSPVSSKAMKDIVERRSANRGPLPGMTERRHAELLDKFGGRADAAMVGNSAAPKVAGDISAAEVADLRRHYGARDAAKMLGITEDEVRRLAPGPSRTPIAAENRIREALQKAKKP